MNANYQNAKNKAGELLEEFTVTEPIVPVFQIAEQKGLKVAIVKMPDKLSNVSGLLDPEKKVIYVNSEDPSNRQAFTVAHELGHFILKHEPNKYGVLPRFAELIASNPLEQEANCFAANFLVPEKMLREAMKQYNLTEHDTDLLAKMFGVSKDVIRYRLKWI